MSWAKGKNHRGSFTVVGLTLLLAGISAASPATPAVSLSASLAAEIDSLEGEREDLQNRLDQLDTALDSLRILKEENAEPLVTTAVPITDEIGDEIDAAERQKYGLFPSVPGFVSAAYFRKPDGTYFIRLRSEGKSGVAVGEKVNSVSLAGIEYVRAAIRRHSN